MGGLDWKKEVGSISPENNAKRIDFYTERANLKLGAEFSKVISELEKNGYKTFSDISGATSGPNEYKVNITEKKYLFGILKEFFMKTFSMDSKKAENETYLSLAYILNRFDGVNVDDLEAGGRCEISCGKLFVYDKSGKATINGADLRPSVPVKPQPQPDGPAHTRIPWPEKPAFKIPEGVTVVDRIGPELLNPKEDLEQYKEILQNNLKLRESITGKITRLDSMPYLDAVGVAKYMEGYEFSYRGMMVQVTKDAKHADIIDEISLTKISKNPALYAEFKDYKFKITASIKKGTSIDDGIDLLLKERVKLQEFEIKKEEKPAPKLPELKPVELKPEVDLRAVEMIKGDGIGVNLVRLKGDPSNFVRVIKDPSSPNYSIENVRNALTQAQAMELAKDILYAERNVGNQVPKEKSKDSPYILDKGKIYFDGTLGKVPIPVTSKDNTALVQEILNVRWERKHLDE